MTTEVKHILRAEGLRFGYRPGKNVLDGVNFQAASGRLVCLLGPNGSGKTTLLRCLLGWLKPQAGTVYADDRPLNQYSSRELARLLAYVPQLPDVAFAFNVQELILMGRYAHVSLLGLTGEKDLAIVREAMKMTQTLDFADRMLGELSGGEAQRVMIARALAQQPSVMLLDEPTSHLDIHHQLKLYRMMQRLAHDWRMAVVCVSHDIHLAARFADELVLMRDGRILAHGPKDRVITSDLLQKAYDVNIHLLPHPALPTPLIWAE